MRLTDRPLTREDVEDVLVLVAPEVDRKRGKIERDIQLDIPLPLPARQVRQILLNLMLNAAHAIERNGAIRLDMRHQGEVMSIRVANDGRHIPEEKLQYLFEPFALASGEGSGLGLWVVYQIVRQLGGELTVESRPGTTVFAVELPLAASGVQLGKQHENEPKPATVPD
jgi:signal transduction histidine kinase